MKRPLRFRREARDDLRNLIEWYESVAPESLPAILADIWRAIDLIREFSGIGAPIEGRLVRKLVTRRYRFKIVYSDADNLITIIGLFRFRIGPNSGKNQAIVPASCNLATSSASSPSEANTSLV